MKEFTPIELSDDNVSDEEFQENMLTRGNIAASTETPQVTEYESELIKEYTARTPLETKEDQKAFRERFKQLMELFTQRISAINKEHENDPATIDIINKAFIDAGLTFTDQITAHTKDNSGKTAENFLTSFINHEIKKAKGEDKEHLGTLLNNMHTALAAQHPNLKDNAS